jgi:hypothetical protein
MPWSTLANNQAVTFNNLQDAVNTGVFLLRNTIPVSNECITKADADFYVYINVSVILKQPNQLVVKQDLTSYTTGIIYNSISGIYPVTGPSSSSFGTLTNNNSFNVFIRGLFNSGGINLGTVGNNRVYYRAYSGGPTIYLYYLSANITNFGQNILTNRDSDNIRPGWFILSPNTTYDITIDKFDGLSSGTTFRLAQGLTSTGTFTAI